MLPVESNKVTEVFPCDAIWRTRRKGRGSRRGRRTERGRMRRRRKEKDEVEEGYNEAMCRPKSTLVSTSSSQ